MKHTFINYFKNAVYLLVFAGFSTVHAGSYDDFFHAVLNDQPVPVKRLLDRGFDANTLDPKGLHGLYIALRERSLKVAQVLVEWPKTDVNILNAKDESALMLAALKGHEQIAEKLMKRGADVNKTGWAPLHYADHRDADRKQRLHRRRVAERHHAADDGRDVRHTRGG